MGVRCSILGHAFEDAGVEREREEQGSEVVTTEREIEQCRRCGAERVVSENTEVAAVVDASDVGMSPGASDVGNLDDAADDDNSDGVADDDDSDDATDDRSKTGGGIAGAVERSELDDADTESEPEYDSPAGSDETDGLTDATDASIVSNAEASEFEVTPEDTEDVEPNPEGEDAEILTDEDEPDRQPGQWPDDLEDGVVDSDPDTVDPADETLSRLTVPEGEIVCPDCSFRIEANSGYRVGDPCPDCNAWLEAERNQ